MIKKGKLFLAIASNYNGSMKMNIKEVSIVSLICMFITQDVCQHRVYDLFFTA